MPNRIGYIPLNPYPERDLILDGATKGVLHTFALRLCCHIDTWQPELRRG